MTAYDPELCERLAREARSCVDHPPQFSTPATRLLPAMADQLDAASHVIARLREQDERQAQKIVELGNERDAAREEVERLDAARYRVTQERLGAVAECEQLRKQNEALQQTIGTERDAGRLQARLREAKAELDRKDRLYASLVNGEDRKLLVAERDRLSAAVARMRPVVEAAKQIRDGRFSIKSTLDRDDRRMFDEFNVTVDAHRAALAKADK